MTNPTYAGLIKRLRQTCLDDAMDDEREEAANALETQGQELAECKAHGSGARAQTKRISEMPDVQAYAGVGDGTVADAVTALIGSKICLQTELAECRKQGQSSIEYSIKLQRMIEAARRHEISLPSSELYHHKMLTFLVTELTDLKARLVEAERLIRDTVHPTQFAVIPPGWVYRRDLFISDGNDPDAARAAGSAEVKS
jgi:hypothetical protein